MDCCLQCIPGPPHPALRSPPLPQLSASQRRLRLCQRGGAPGVLCCMVHTLVVPQLPAALAPPALFAAARALLYAAAWLLYQTAALTIPLALWLAFAAGGSLALSPDAVAAAARLNPALGHAARALPTAAPLPRALVERPGAGLLILPLLLVLLRLAEGVVQRSRQEHWEQRRRRVTAADLQAQYQGWALPGSSTSVRSDAAAAAAVQLEQGAVLDTLRHEVGQLWHAVYGGESLPPEQLTSMQGECAGLQLPEKNVCWSPGSWLAGRSSDGPLSRWAG